MGWFGWFGLVRFGSVWLFYKIRKMRRGQPGAVDRSATTVAFAEGLGAMIAKECEKNTNKKKNRGR